VPLRATLSANRRLLFALVVLGLVVLMGIGSIANLEGTCLVTTPAADNPTVIATLERVERPSFVDRLSLVTPATLALFSVAVMVLLAACVIAVAIGAFGGVASLRRPRAGFASPRLAAVSMAVLFVAVFSAKLFLMYRNPVTVPYWDQWDGEARALYLPFKTCSLTWIQMFAQHNEHRFFFSRLLALDLLLVNGQWDPRLQQVVNAALHSLIAVLVVAILWRAQQWQRLGLLVLIGVLTFALPFAWENTLLGFQSGFYFLLLFSILGLWLTTTSRVRTLQWALGWLCALCGLFTGASGLLLAVAIAGVAALGVMNDRREWTDARSTFAAAAAILAVGLLTASSPLPYHEVLRAKTMSDFTGALGRNLAWPWVTNPQLTVVMWLPMGVLLFIVARRQAQMTLLERFTIGLGIWVVLHAAAFAYARGAGAPVPAARYQDFLSLGFVANAMAAIAGFDRIGAGPTARRVAATVLASWFLVPVVGLHSLVVDTQTTLSHWRQYWSAHASTVRRYVLAGDLAEFVSKRPIEQLPYPHAQVLAALLREPQIRRILPAAVREPVRVEPRTVTNDAFVSEGVSPTTSRDPAVRSWGSYTSQGALARGIFESRPIESCQSGNKLQFEVAGYLSARHQYLAVKNLDSGREQDVKLGKTATVGWMSALISCPAGPYAIMAVDATPDQWFSFREPVEVGRVSPMVEWLIAVSPQLLVAAALGVLANSGYQGCRRLRRVVHVAGPGATRRPS
jgi:hypothetical protein